jgi:hypothetical protein
MPTFADSVEELKREYTDKYVVVDPSRPELARFEHYVGQVKTVNMSGRALVEFLDYHLNIGWFDIDPRALTIVEKPSPELTRKPEAKRPHDKPVGKAAPTTGDKQDADAAAVKKLSPLEMARQQGALKAAGAAPSGAAKPASGGGKPSVADILAAARAGKPAAGAGPAAAAAPAEPKAEKPKPAPAAPKPAAADGKIRRVDKSNMTIDQILAYCREHDANRAA